MALLVIPTALQKLFAESEIEALVASVAKSIAAAEAAKERSIAELEAALLPFAEAYRKASQESVFGMVTLQGWCKVEHFARAAELVKDRRADVSDLETWRKAVAAEGAARGLMPALLEFFDDYISEGDTPERALERAKRSCEVVEIVEDIEL
jgi:hypothetical protein